MPLCRRCKEGQRVDKPLSRCINCKKYYHAACHRPPPPENAVDWTCQKCLAPDNSQMRRRYHDTASTSSFATNGSSSSLRQGNPEATMPRIGGSFTPDSNDADLFVVQCSFPGCTAQPADNGAVCFAHLMRLTGEQGSAPRPVPHQPSTFQTTKARLVPDGDSSSVLPFLRRKTAQSGPLPRRPPSSSAATAATATTTIPEKGTAAAGLSVARSASGWRHDALPTSLKTPPRNSEPERKRIRLATGLESRPEMRNTNGLMNASAGSTAADKAPPIPTQNGAPSLAPPPSRYGHKVDPVAKSSTKRFSRPQVIRKMAAPNRDPFLTTVPENGKPPPRNFGPGASADPGPHQSSRSATNGLSRVEIAHKVSSLQDRNQEKSGGFEGNKSLLEWFSKSQSPQREDKMNRWKPSQRLWSNPAAATGRTTAPAVAKATHPANGQPESREGPRPDDPCVGASQLPTTDSARQLKTLPLQPSQKPPTPKATVADRPARQKTEELHPRRPPETAAEPRAAEPKAAKPKAAKPKAPEPKAAEPKAAAVRASKRVNEPEFDAWIYSQPTASEPPPGVDRHRGPHDTSPVTRSPIPRPRDEPYYAHIDPRLHWPQPRSERWWRAKQEEIQARGGRKANFGKAAERMREQRVREGPARLEDRLPDRILQNPSWVRALKTLHAPQDNPRQQDHHHYQQQPEKRTQKQGLRRNPSAGGAGAARKLAP